MKNSIAISSLIVLPWGVFAQGPTDISTATPPSQSIFSGAHIDFWSPLAPPKVASLGGRIPTPIYEDGKGNFYFVPALLPDWVGYETSVMERCASAADSVSGTDSSAETTMPTESDRGEAAEAIVPIDLEIFLDDPVYRDEIFVYLRETYNPGIVSYRLNTLPYDVVRIILRIGEDGRVIYTNDENYGFYADQKYARAMSAGLVTSHLTNLELTCEDHLQLTAQVKAGKRSDTISGELYFRGVDFSINSMHYISSIGVTDEIIRRILSEESTKVEYRGQSNGGLWSINIPVLDLPVGGGSTEGSSGLDALRIVSRDVIDDVVSSAFSRSTLSCVGPNGCRDAEKLILTGLSAQPLALQLRRNADESFSLFDNQTEYVTITDSQLKGSFQAALRELEKKNVAVSTGADQKIEQSTESDASTSGQGELGGTMPISVNAELYLVSKSVFDDFVERRVVERIPVAATNYFFPLLYPAAEYASGAIARPGSEEPVLRRQSCEDTSAFIKVTENPTDHFRSTRVDGKVSGTLKASPDTYLVNPVITKTSSHNGEISGVARVPHPDGPRQGGEVVVYSEVKASFSCNRGHNGSRRSCRASGVIEALEVPFYCLPFVGGNGVPEL